MLQKPTFHSTWLPMGLAAAALAVLNVGLYTRLAAQPSAAPALSLPYSTDYTTDELAVYSPLGGDWEIIDQSLIQLNTTGFDLGTHIPLDISADQPYFFEAQMRLVGGTSGGGLLFNVQQPGTRQQSHMVRFNVDGDQLWLIYGYFADDSNFTGQGSAALTIPPSNTDSHQLRVEVVGNTYALLLDGQIVAADVPVQYPGGAVGLVTAAAQVAFDDVRVDVLSAPSALEPAVQAADPSVTPENPAITSLFDETFQGGETANTNWAPISGTWQFEPGGYVQTQPDGYDYSSGYRQGVAAPYTLRTTFQHRTGAGGGVLFNMLQPDSKNGAYMVRYIPDTNVVAWGYFDASGSFQGQGSAAVAPPGTEAHILEVQAGTRGYSISLDGVSLVQGVPLMDTTGVRYIGLTSSLSTVAYQQVTVLGGEPEGELVLPTAIPIPSLNVQGSTGSWTITDNLITQTTPDLTDFLAGTGVAAQRFSLSVDLLLPTDNAEAGGGLVFDMAGRDDPRGGTMLRLANGGSLIFWGQYDAATGAFRGQGSAPLSLTPGEWAAVKLDVHANSFDILVNGTLVAEALPRSSDTGWLGLLSFAGPVQFANIQLTLGGL